MPKLQEDFTEGSIEKHLIKFGLPFLISNLLQALYSVADMLIVGHYCGAESLSGVSIGGQVTNLVVMLVSGLTVGGTVLVAQYLGARQEENVKETIGTMFSMLGILAAALTAVMLVLARPLLNALQTPAESYDEALNYFRICLYGNIFVFGYNAITAVQRGMGDSKRPMFFVGIACVMNVFLDLLLVGKLGMRSAGAAWATIASQGFSMLLAAAYLARNRFVFDFKSASFRIKKDKLQKLLQIGLPTSVQSVVTNLSFLLMTALVNGFGVYASAAVGVAGKLNSFAILPVVAMSSSVSAIAAQNIGAGLHDRAFQTFKRGVITSLKMGVCVFAIVQLFPQAILSPFSDDARVIEAGVRYLRAFSFDYLMVPLGFCLSGLLNGAGFTNMSMLFSMLSSIILRMPAAWLLSMTPMGLAGVGIAAPLATLGSNIVGVWFLSTGRWRENRTGIHRAVS